MRTTILLLLLALVTSCNAQNNTANKTPAKQPGIMKTHGTTKYDNVYCALQDKAGNMWFGTTGEGVYRYDGKTFTRFTMADGLTDNNVYAIAQDRDGSIWLGTRHGACRYDGKRFVVYALPTGSGSADAMPFTGAAAYKANNVPATSVTSILQDRRGNLWFGTAQNGVYRLDAQSLAVHQKVFDNYLGKDGTVYNDNRDHQSIQSILQDAAGNIWLSSWNRGGVWRCDGTATASCKSSFTNFRYKDGLDDNMIFGMATNKQGDILFATRDHGLYKYDGKVFANLSAQIGLPNTNISCVLQDKSGNLWLGTDGKIGADGSGVYRYDGKSITNFTTKDGLSNNNVFCIVEDKIGNIWLGTRNVGLCRYDGNRFTDFTSNQ